MTDLAFHPAANEFPLLDDGRIEELAQDIKANGQCEPIRLFEGRIVDGRNRYLACLKAGIEPWTESLPDSADPFGSVWSFNGERRDLTQDQRYLIWKSCAQKSGAWQGQQKHLIDRANQARRDRQKDRPRDTTAERPSTNCGRSFPPRGQGSHVRAVASGTNRGAVERMDRLERQRPDLAEDIRLGRITSSDAMRQMAGPHVANNGGDNEWYTPEDYIRRARAVMGGIDLDPASSPEANAVVGANRFYTAAEDGLSQPWKGRVFMNPPYAQPLIQRFCETLANHCRSGGVTEAVVLVNNATETRWFQTLLGEASAVCFPAGRVKFWHPEKVSAPLQGQAVIYMGPMAESFDRCFCDLGVVCRVT